MYILNCNAGFPCGVFESKEKAEEAIKKYKLTGTLTKYPVNILVYDWAIENKHLYKNEDKHTKEYIGAYTTAYQEHYHYENGE